MKKKFLNTILVTVFFITNTLTVLADCPTCPTGLPIPNGTDDEPAGAPIDQTVILLLAGLIVACYFIAKQKTVKS